MKVVDEMKELPLACPCEVKQTLTKMKDVYICDNRECEHNKMENGFPCVNSIPIIISETRTDTVCAMEAGKTYVQRPLSKFVGIKKILVGESEITKGNCEKFLAELFRDNKKPKVLVVGGGATGSGSDKLWTAKDIEIHSIDIYASDSVDIVCDAHYLPLKNDFYDGVWIQAVLEHVVEPIAVVDQIYRVLKLGGIVYAETPFLQQVHEGAYDFTRYTVLGHRWLFRKFELIDLGGIKGPEVVFVWSVRYLIQALLRNRSAARFVGILLGLLTRPLGKLVSKESLYDSSSGVYFIGKKVPHVKIAHKDLISLYKGGS